MTKKLYRVGAGHKVFSDEHNREFAEGETLEIEDVPGTEIMVEQGILVLISRHKKEKPDGSNDERDQL